MHDADVKAGADSEGEPEGAVSLVPQHAPHCSCFYLLSTHFKGLSTFSSDS